jgi:hypothetical protein
LCMRMRMRRKQQGDANVRIFDFVCFGQFFLITYIGIM